MLKCSRVPCYHQEWPNFSCISCTMMLNMTARKKLTTKACTVSAAPATMARAGPRTRAPYPWMTAPPPHLPLHPPRHGPRGRRRWACPDGGARCWSLPSPRSGPDGGCSGACRGGMVFWCDGSSRVDGWTATGEWRLSTRRFALGKNAAGGNLILYLVWEDGVVFYTDRAPHYAVPAHMRSSIPAYAKPASGGSNCMVPCINFIRHREPNTVLKRGHSSKSCEDSPLQSTDQPLTECAATISTSHATPPSMHHP